MKSWILGGLAAACVLSLSSSALASKIVSVYSTYPEQVPPTVDPITGASTSPYGYQYFAEQFSPDQTGLVTSIDLPLTLEGGTSDVTVELLTDSGNSPGTVLGSWAITSFPTYTCCGAVSTIDLNVASADIKLDVGQNYWIEVLPGADDTFVGWAYAANELSTPTWIQFPGEGPTFPVLEQSFTVQAFEIDASVPEPASWALAIGGLGLVGAMMRRRRMVLA